MPPAESTKRGRLCQSAAAASEAAAANNGCKILSAAACAAAADALGAAAAAADSWAGHEGTRVICLETEDAVGQLACTAANICRPFWVSTMVTGTYCCCSCGGACGGGA